MANHNLHQLLAKATEQLTPTSASPRLDAEILLSYTLQKNRTYLLARPEYQPNAQQSELFTRLLQRRLAGEPIAYITEQREFWSLSLRVSPATLIPRPETELLVEQALQFIPENQATRVADLGTGSGCIALAIASERPQCEITAIDKSATALATARHNQQTLGIHNVVLLCNNWLTGLDLKPFDLIISNPPYVAPGDPHLRQGDLPYEPIEALVADNQGLADIEQICRQAKHYLRQDGWLLLEHGYNQKQPVAQILAAHGYHDITCLHDLAGMPRVTQARFN